MGQCLACLFDPRSPWLQTLGCVLPRPRRCPTPRPMWCTGMNPASLRWGSNPATQRNLKSWRDQRTNRCCFVSGVGLEPDAYHAEELTPEKLITEKTGDGWKHIDRLQEFVFRPDICRTSKALRKNAYLTLVITVAQRCLHLLLACPLIHHKKSFWYIIYERFQVIGILKGRP